MQEKGIEKRKVILPKAQNASWSASDKPEEFRVPWVLLWVGSIVEPFSIMMKDSSPKHLLTSPVSKRDKRS